MYYNPSNPELSTMKCPYHNKKPGDKDPHHHIPFDPKAEIKIHDTILSAIGRTPLVRLNKIPVSEGV